MASSLDILYVSSKDLAISLALQASPSMMVSSSSSELLIIVLLTKMNVQIGNIHFHALRPANEIFSEMSSETMFE